MQITAMEPRRHRLTALFLDGEFAVNIDTETLLRSGLRLGRELSDEALHELLKESEARRANEKALFLLERRSHSKKELSDKLSRTVGREYAEEAAGRMEELGLVDDAEYASRYARELFRKGFARRRVLYELSLKGISKEQAQAALLETEPDPEEQIRRVIEKKYRDLSDEKARRRASAALQRLGFGAGEIRAALAAFSTEEEPYGEFGGDD